ncbi:MAG: hypothetical protein JJE09_12410 [Bacteroidia bacterium]|nr:hypothetical protein [Bacteroidia bacterium]
MERIKQKLDEQLLQYLDGILTQNERIELEELLARNTHLTNRLAELRSIHNALSTTSRLEQPSKVFTDKVMTNLDQLPARSALSPKNGLLLLFGILVAVGVMALLLSLGVFDNMNDTLSFDNFPIENKFIKNPLPTIQFNGKWMVNGILILTMGLAFVLLDRTILKPYFERRSRIQF